MLAARLRHAALAIVLLSPRLAAAQGKPVPASADAQAAARTKAHEGLKLYAANRWAEALAAFREADASFHAPSVAIYIARCQRSLGKLVDARATYAKLVAEDLPQDAPAAFVTAHVDAARELEIVRERTPWLRVVVTGVPAGEARVTLNGAPLGDEKKDLDPGTYTVEASARGAAPVTRTITLSEASHETVTLDLHASASAPADASTPHAALKGATQAPRRVPAYVSFGVGGAGLVLGAVFGGLALKQASDVNAVCKPSVPCPQEASAHDAALTKATVSDVGFGVALAGAVAGTVLLLVNRTPAAQSAVQSALGPGGATLRF